MEEVTVVSQAASTPELAVGLLSAVAFAFVFVVALGASALHLLLATLRMVLRRGARWDGWTFAYFGPFVVALAVLVPLSFLERLQNPTFGAAAAVIVATTLFAPPVFVPILRAYRGARVTFLTYAHTLAALMALPVAMTLFTFMLATLGDEGAGPTGALTERLFVLETSFEPCQRAMIRILGLSVPDSLAAARKDEFVYLMQFWVDTTVKAILFDAFEVYGCSLSTVTHRPDNFLMASLVFGYRTFAAAAVLAILLLPFRRRGT